MFPCRLLGQGQIWTNMLDAVGCTNNGRTDGLDLGESSREHGLTARHSLLNARGTEWLSLVSQTINQQGLAQIWNSLVFFIVD